MADPSPDLVLIHVPDRLGCEDTKAMLVPFLSEDQQNSPIPLNTAEVWGHEGVSELDVPRSFSEDMEFPLKRTRTGTVAPSCPRAAEK